jgi:hypothetical protein
VHKEYQFYLKAVALGGAEAFSPLFTLIVGCTESLVITESTLNVANIDADIRYGVEFTFYPPSTDLAYCLPESTEFIDLQSNGNPDASRIQPIDFCTDPCFTF